MARMAARWLARAAVRTALARLTGSGLALSKQVLRAAGTSGRSGSGTVSVGGGASGGERVGAAAIVTATPDVAGGAGPSSAPLLPSSCRLFLLARSHLRLPESQARACVAWSESPPVAVGRNQRHISSDLGCSIGLQHQSCRYALPPAAHPRHVLAVCAWWKEGGDWLLVWAWAGVLLHTADGRARIWSPISPLLDPPLATSAQLGEGEGGGGGVAC